MSLRGQIEQDSIQVLRETKGTAATNDTWAVVDTQLGRIDTAKGDTTRVNGKQTTIRPPRAYFMYGLIVQEGDRLKYVDTTTNGSNEYKVISIGDPANKHRFIQLDLHEVKQS